VTVSQVIWFMWFWVVAYYGLARTVLAKINKDDPDYFELSSTDGRLPFGMKTSVAIWDMVWDTDLPGEEFGGFVRYGLYAVRALFVLYVPAAVILFYNVN
jgi:hypothetical protein